MDVFSRPGEDIRRVSREELYTSFRKRMAFLQAFVGFTDDDIVIFNKGAKYLKTAIGSLTHRLYQKMLEFDITARALRTRSTASEAEVDDLFTIDSPHVQRRKIFWKWYLTRFFSDPGQLEYWDYLEKVGKMHTGQILMHPLTIEYTHMNACLGYLKQLLLETISLHPDMTVPFKFSLIRSISKILCIQNDLIAKCYTREGEEFTQNAAAAHNTPQTESIPASEVESRPPSAATSAQHEQDPGSPRAVPSLSLSRPTTAGDTQRSRESLVPVSSTADTALSSDTGSIASTSQLSSESSAVSAAFASPFSVEHLQTFETKIWSGGARSKGYASG